MAEAVMDEEVTWFDAVDDDGFDVGGPTAAHVQSVRDVLIDALLRPMSAGGCPLSALHGKQNDSIKAAFIGLDEEAGGAFYDAFFGEPQGHNTHQRCMMLVHEGVATVKLEGASPSLEDLAQLPGAWRLSGRVEVESRGRRLEASSLLATLLLGPGDGAEVDGEHCETNDVRVQVMGLANPVGPQCHLDSAQEIFRLVHQWSLAGVLGGSAGRAMIIALGEVLPETRGVLSAFFLGSDTEHRVEGIDGVPGILRHTLSTSWNWDGLACRFSSEVADDLRSRRPLHAVYTIENAANDNAYSILVITEDDGTLEARFITAESGNPVWFDANNAPAVDVGGTPLVARNFFEGFSMRLRIAEMKFNMGRLGCLFGDLDAPTIVLSVQCRRDPHPIISLRCLEVGEFPMEWAYGPFIDAGLLRGLLVAQFREEIHFAGDEFHILASFQTPRIGSVLLMLLKQFWGFIMKTLKTPADLDPRATLRAAMCEDLRALEQEMNFNAVIGCTKAKHIS